MQVLNRIGAAVDDTKVSVDQSVVRSVSVSPEADSPGTQDVLPASESEGSMRANTASSIGTEVIPNAVTMTVREAVAIANAALLQDATTVNHTAATLLEDANTVKVTTVTFLWDKAMKPEVLLPH